MRFTSPRFLYVLSHQKKVARTFRSFSPSSSFFRAILIWSVVKGQSHTFPFQSLGPVQGIPSSLTQEPSSADTWAGIYPPDRMDKAAQQQKVRYADSCQEL